MTISASELTESKYYSNDFDAAIFDDPCRIYFAQYQEELALKVYFYLREYFSQVKKPNSFLQENSIFVLLYPSEIIFNQFFPKDEEPIVTRKIGESHLVACSFPISDKDYKKIAETFCSKCDFFKESSLKSSFA